MRWRRGQQEELQRQNRCQPATELQKTQESWAYHLNIISINGNRRAEGFQVIDQMPGRGGGVGFEGLAGGCSCYAAHGFAIWFWAGNQGLLTQSGVDGVPPQRAKIALWGPRRCERKSAQNRGPRGQVFVCGVETRRRTKTLAIPRRGRQRGMSGFPPQRPRPVVGAPDFRRNLEGRGQFFPSLCRSSLQ